MLLIKRAVSSRVGSWIHGGEPRSVEDRGGLGVGSKKAQMPFCDGDAEGVKFRSDRVEGKQARKHEGGRIAMRTVRVWHARPGLVRAVI